VPAQIEEPLLSDKQKRALPLRGGDLPPTRRKGGGARKVHPETKGITGAVFSKKRTRNSSPGREKQTCGSWRGGFKEKEDEGASTSFREKEEVDLPEKEGEERVRSTSTSSFRPKKKENPG